METNIFWAYNVTARVIGEDSEKEAQKRQGGYPWLHKHNVVRIHSSNWKRILTLWCKESKKAKQMNNEVHWSTYQKQFIFNWRDRLLTLFYHTAVQAYESWNDRVFFYFCLETTLLLPPWWTCSF